jgi:hypothetical protein
MQTRCRGGKRAAIMPCSSPPRRGPNGFTLNTKSLIAAATSCRASRLALAATGSSAPSLPTGIHVTVLNPSVSTKVSAGRPGVMLINHSRFGTSARRGTFTGVPAGTAAFCGSFRGRLCKRSCRHDDEHGDRRDNSKGHTNLLSEIRRDAATVLVSNVLIQGPDRCQQWVAWIVR